MSKSATPARPPRSAVAATAWVVSLVAVVLDLGLFGLDALQPLGRKGSDLAPRLLFPLIAAAFATVGFLIVSRVATSFTGRLFAVLGLAVGVGGLTWEYGIRTTVVHPASLFLGDWAFWVGGWLPFLMIPAIPLLLLAFPDGASLGRRWRIAWAFAIAGVPLFILQDLPPHMPAGLVAFLGRGPAPLDVVNGPVFGALGNRTWWRSR